MNKKIRMALTTMLACNMTAFAQSDIFWKNHFGGGERDFYYSVTAVPDGMVAAGYSVSDSFGNGDWEGVMGNGNYDAIIVKYNLDGTLAWIKNFGGGGHDEYRSVTAVSDGIVAVGYSYIGSGTGDWEGVTGKGYYDAIIVKYNSDGSIAWKKNFGGRERNEYFFVTAVSDGIVAVGRSGDSSFGNGDWEGVTGKGFNDAIIVKYNSDGSVAWKKNFGGSDNDLYYSVTAVSDGIVAVGYSASGSFGNGDWEGVTGKGEQDAIIVKYNFDGTLVWKNYFGGNKDDCYYSVTAVSDGMVAVGYSYFDFGTGDWEGVTGKGFSDAIIVKYNLDGSIAWKNYFGGSGNDIYWSVTTVSDGIVAAGYSENMSFGNGDWEGVTGKGNDNAVLVKYNLDGSIAWKRNFGGSGNDYYKSVTAVSDGMVAVGYSYLFSFGYGDWEGFTGKGDIDAIIVKYGTISETFVPVTNITDVPATATAGTPLMLVGIVTPDNATNQTIAWSVQNSGATGATIADNTLHTTAAGTATVRANIVDGVAVAVNYAQDFDITVNATQVTTAPELVSANPLRAWVRDGALHVEGLTVGGTLSVYTATGTLVYQNTVTFDRTDITLTAQGVYIVRHGDHAIKVTH